MVIHMVAAAAFGVALSLFGHGIDTPGYWILTGLAVVICYTNPHLYD